MTKTKKSALIILDGWGKGLDPKRSALAQASTPFIHKLQEDNPTAELITFGKEVGLPAGQMGNSEVGHLNIGAGRIVYQDLAKINKAIEEDALKDNETLIAAIEHAEKTSKRFHLLGLVSDGGVHAHIDHLLALTDILKDRDLEVFIHAIMDGRDTSPSGGKDYLNTVINHVSGTNAQVVSVIGRYFAMDRDNRWERVKKAYDLFVKGTGTATTDVASELISQYDADITDEFLEPIKLVKGNKSMGLMESGDTVLFYNYRTDRPREITKMLHQEAFPEHGTSPVPLHFVSMTMYDETFEGVHVMFSKDNIKNTIGEVVSKAGLSQVRIAETEKYPHVTFFFSGGQEEPFSGEDRILVKSPDVATYDLQPEMSAPEVTEKLIHHVQEKQPDFICLNYANTDMVGHTGDFEAAVKSAETVDQCLSDLVPILQQYDYETIIIADHGNSDIMVNEDGSPHTAHTTNMVPIIYVGSVKEACINDGILADVAPTLLHLMGVNIPEDMSGNILIEKEINQA